MGIKKRDFHITLSTWVILHAFLSSADFFQINFFRKEIPPVSKSLNPDQDRRSVGPYLGPNCLQTSRQRVGQLLIL